MSEGNSSEPCAQLNFLECHIAVVIWKVYSPIFILVGVTGNTMSIVVLSRKRLCFTTTSVYLRVLAVVDTLVLLVGVLRYLVFNYSLIDIKELSDLSCKIHGWLIYNGNALSSWFLSVIALDRLISVKYPLWTKTNCTQKLAALISVGLVAIISLINSHMLLFLYKEKIYVYSNMSHTRIVLDVKCSGSSFQYRIFLEKIWPVLVLLSYSIAPIICLTTCSIILIRLLSVRDSKKLGRNRNGVSGKQDRKDLRSLTKMLIAVCIFFVIISVPTCIYLIAEPYLFDSTSAHSIAKRELAWAIVTFLLYCNNTFNFVLYCLSGSLFRKELLEILWKIKITLLKCINSKIHPIENLNEMIEEHNPGQSIIGKNTTGPAVTTNETLSR